MKYENQFGIGEIVTTRQLRRGDRIIPDLIGEVMGVSFDKAATTVFVRLIDGSVQAFRERELEGDPDFDQVAGCYPSPPA